MPKYVHLSRVYLTDSELYELISPKNIGHRDLLRLARARGMIFSEKSANDFVRSQLVMLPSDLPTVHSLFKRIEKPDPEESNCSLRIHGCAPDTDTHALIDSVRTAREKNHDEIYNVTKVSDTVTRVDITYIDIDYSRAQIYQRRERKCSVEVTKENDNVAIVYNAAQRAQQVVDALQAGILSAPDKRPNIVSISLLGVRDPARRTAFMLDIVRSVAGFKFENATDLHVDRRFPELETEEEEAPSSDEADEQEEQKQRESEAKATSQEMKAFVNKMALSGEQVLLTDIYQKAASSGYYISTIRWECHDETDARIHLDCEISFLDPVKANQFTFEVRRRWKDDAAYPKRGLQMALTQEDKRRLNGLLETAAFAAYAKLALETPDGATSPSATTS